MTMQEIFKTATQPVIMYKEQHNAFYIITPFAFKNPKKFQLALKKQKEGFQPIVSQTKEEYKARQAELNANKARFDEWHGSTR